MLKRMLWVSACLWLGAVSPAMADEAADVQRIRAALADLMPGAPDSITASPAAGLYEVVFDANLVYVTADGKHLIQGNVTDLASRKDITEPRRDVIRSQAVDAMGEDKMVIYQPKKTRHTITVFTDIDCGYCRKLHSELDQFMDEGIRVRYMYYPRSGPDTPSYYKAVNSWCAKDRNAALTLSKAGKSIADERCDNPVMDHMRLANMLGVRGTPSIILEDGRMVPGYVPARRLLKYLEDKDVRP